MRAIQLTFSAWRCGGLAGAFALIFLAGISAAVPSANAHWLTKILREAGEAGGGAARHARKGLDELDGLSRHLKSLPHDGKSAALAAHATPEGHWKFSNREGEVFTAANADEMARVVKTLAPDHVDEGKLKLFLSEDTVFERPAMLKELPAGAELYLMADKRSYRLRPDRERAAQHGFLAEIKPNLELRLGERRFFDEALWHLKRPLSKSGIRVVSLEPGAAQTLSASPRLETGSKAALIDKIDPWKLPAAVSSIRGQTLVVTGRIEGEFLHFRPSSGGEKSLLIGDLKRAAKEADVNLFVLQSAGAHQPGGRNWFWQTVEVKGLDQAMKRADFGDFLDALGQHRQAMVVEARSGADGRIGFDVRPAGSSSGAAGDGIADTMMTWTEHVFAEALGNVITSGIDADLVDKERQSELDMRIVPGIPSTLQFLYIAGLVLGVAGLSYVRAWWAWLWPAEERCEYANGLGYQAARFIRFVLLTLVFMPLVGVPAGFWAVLAGFFQQVWFFLTLPFRALRWLWRRIVPAG